MPIRFPRVVAIVVCAAVVFVCLAGATADRPPATPMRIGHGQGPSSVTSPVTNGAHGGAVSEFPPCASTVYAADVQHVGPMVFDGSDLYVATGDAGAGTILIKKIDAAGVPTLFATLDASNSAGVSMGYPTDLALDAAGNLFVAATHNNPGLYWKVAPDGTVSPVSSGTGRGPSSIEFDDDGNLFVADVFADNIFKNGASFASASTFMSDSNGLLWADSTLYAIVFDYGVNADVINKVNETGSFATVANTGAFPTPSFALEDGTGLFYFFDSGLWTDRIGRVGPGGSATVICDFGTKLGSNADIKFGPDGALYVSDFRTGTILKLNPHTADEQVESLIDEVSGLSIPAGTKDSLTAKLDAALRSLASGNGQAASGQLGAFINEVEAKCCAPQPGKPLTRSQADGLIAAAEAVLSRLA